MADLTHEQKMRNVASILRQYTEVTRQHNGKGRPPTYAARVDAIAQTGRHLADMVLAYLDAGGLDGAHGLDGEAEPAGVTRDDLPF